ncbi:MAG: DNA-formamidopyrimidine glycosylase [Bacilli bacterium]|nr:DNA-formamidopyrimidine glycosylase [Bacilli bacterium]
MPELPEVETVRRTLEAKIVGKRIKNIEVFYEKMLEDINTKEFKKSLIGEKLCSFYRYGKYLVFIFEHVSLISHLRMEGKYFIKTVDDPIEKHEHIVFEFEDGTSLRYHDTRKFGIMTIVKSVDIQDIMKYKGIVKLGPEANVSTDFEGLYNKLKTKNMPVKTLLLDQENLAGLGNIYVDEVLFKSKIHPLTLGKDLILDQVKLILDNSREILKYAIECGGTTIRSYTSSLGVTGRFQINLMVHTKVGQPCINCGTTIEKTVVGGRGTYICPSCQKVYKKIKVVGVTGVIASGKTAVTDYLKQENYPVIDADEISRDLLDKNSKYLKTIVDELTKKWGKTKVDEFYYEGAIDRKALGVIIFNDTSKREDLNNIMHPIVKKIINSDILRQKNAIIKKIEEKTLIFVSVPLLLEAKYEDICDYIMIVSCKEDIIVERLMKRDNINKEYALKKMASQMSLSEKVARCEEIGIDYVVLNNDTGLSDTYQKINEVIKNI